MKNENLKPKKELKEGPCKVVTINRISNRKKIFEGRYDKELDVVFFAIPDYYEVIAYTQ